MAITQSEIGGIVGLSREGTNRFLRAWQERGWVQLQRGGIVARAPEVLATLASAGAPDDATLTRSNRRPGSAQS